MNPTRRPTLALLTAGLMAAATPLVAQRGPAPEKTHLSADVIAHACASALAFERPIESLLITGGQDSTTRHVYGPGDLATINGGSDNGIEVGQEYYVRRLQAPRGYSMSREHPGSVRTAGWVRVYAVDKTMSLVTVSHACDILRVGDYLEPFTVPQSPVPDANPPKPQRENYGHILMGDDRRTMFAKNDFFTVDRGSDHGVTLGARFIIFRDKRRMETQHKASMKDLPDAITTPEFLYEMGEAVVVDVKPEVSTVKALFARDAFLSGDWVALRK